ncbi:MAG: glutathione S-transferase, partial [Paracoccaceae bacterium]
LDALERRAATAPGWLSPDRPTLLALYVGMLMRWLGQLPEDHPAQFPAAGWPALCAALARTEAWPAVLRVAEAEELGPTVFTAPAC